MAKLSYKTRGNSSPDGKQKVWFSCHPDDWERVFERVTDGILKSQNCVIWYDEEPEADYDAEAFFQLLGQMQLFVVPVTRRLLTTANRTLDKELAFARAPENQIPVLPVLMESGQDSEFEKRFGSIQYLDFTARDITQKSYQEKLDIFLAQVLTGDRLAEEIRGHFDVYLFLSYRKKDRTYAQELMRRIHENELFRGVGIWYDEYLIPGENYNDSIADALSKSPIFALVVTPNLINEDNYVASKEYPQAHKERKYILPFELADTDQERMYEVFDGIRKNISARDVVAVREELKKALAVLAVTPDEQSSERQYYLGQAYLSGIDVEINSEFALGFLLAAAQAGEERAMESLADMYERGNRVHRDMHEAGYWRKRQAEAFWKHYEREPEEYLEVYSDALVKLCFFYNETGDINAQRDSAMRLLDITEGAKSQKKAGLLWRRLIAGRMMISLALSEKNFDAALKYAYKFLEACELMATINDFADILEEYWGGERIDQTQSEKSSGQVQNVSSNEKAHKQENDRIVQNQEVGRLTAEAYYRISSIQRLQQQNDAAMDSLEKATEALSQIPNDNSAEYKMLRSGILQSKADIYRAKQDVEGEQECLLQEERLLIEIVEEFPSADHTNRLAECRINIAKQYYGQGKEPEAGKLCREAVDCAVSQIPQIYGITSRNILANTIAAGAMLMEDMKERSVAREYYIIAMNLILEASEEMVPSSKTAEEVYGTLLACHKFLNTDEDRHLLSWDAQPGKYINARRNVGLGYERLAEDYASKAGNGTGGMATFANSDKAMQIFTDLADELGDDFDRYHAVVNMLGFLNSTPGGSRETLKLYDYGIEECEELIRGGRKPEYLALLCGYYDGAGRFCLKLNLFSEAMRYYSKALPIHREQPQEYRTWKERQNYVNVLLLYIDVSHRMANDGAELSFRSELRCIYTELLAFSKGDEEKPNEIWNLYQLMKLYRKKNDWDNARTMAKKIESQYASKLLYDDRNLELHRVFFETYQCLLWCMSYDGGQNTEDGKEYYEKALPLIAAIYNRTGLEDDAKLLCDTQIHLANRDGDREHASELYRSALKLAEKYLAQDQNASDQLLDLAAQAHMEIAKDLLETDRAKRRDRRLRIGKSRKRKEAEDHLKKAAAAWEMLAGKHPDVEQYRKSRDETVERMKKM